MTKLEQSRGYKLRRFRRNAVRVREVPELESLFLAEFLADMGNINFQRCSRLGLQPA